MTQRAQRARPANLTVRAALGLRCGASTAALLWFLASAPPALAQDSSVEADAAAGVQAAADDAAGGEILVTGSRVSDGFQAPTPVTVITADELLARAPSSLSDALNQIPQFTNSDTTASNGVTTGSNSGASFLNLRGLGSNRTLTLLDGRRVAPSTGAGVTDVSILPEGLIQRVDVVTGGASAVYGSDAVAGVVNYILDTRFEGIKGLIQGGISDRGDAENVKAQLSVGTSLADDRLHVIASGEYYKHEGVENYASRDWFDSCARIANPAGTPATMLACDVHSSGFTYGGLIPSGPLRGTQFLPGGVAAPFVYGDLLTASSMVGGDGAGGENPDVGAYFQPMTALERMTGFARVEYELTDNVSVFGQYLYGRSETNYVGTWPWQGNSSGFTIQIDNAYLPDSVRQRMIDADVTTFPLNRYDYDFGPLLNTNVNTTHEFVAGLDADIGRFRFEAYYEHGENRMVLTTLNNPIVNNEYNAVDAVVDPDTGDIVCRSTLTQPGNGCVPINLFGSGSPSPEALDYILGTTWQDLRVKQDVVEASIAGEAFELWAGPVTVAAGGGYRRESASQEVDPISTSYKHFTGGYFGFPAALEGQLGGFDRSNPGEISGSYDLWELFGEIDLPLARDLPFAQELDLNAGVRLTDYSTSGSVTSWKVGMSYVPVDGIRFRAARSRDIRAANLNELYTDPRQGQSNLVDPFQPVGSPNRSLPVYVISSGNLDLKPEKADTTTFGVVLQPAFFPGFGASVDYYDIELEDAISTLGAQVTIDQCFGGATELCSQLTRDQDGLLLSVATPFLNIASLETSGIDFEANYRHALGTGQLSLRLLANYVDKYVITNPGAQPIELSGQTGRTGIPDWQGSFSVQYDNGPLMIRVQERFINSGTLDNNLSPTVLDPSENHVDEVFYTDLTANYGFDVGGSEAIVYFTVNNLFDQDPPMAPSPYFVFGTSWGGTNPALFDIVGRRYTLGVRFKL